MQVKDRLKQEEKRVLSTRITPPSFERIAKVSDQEERKDYFSMALFIGLAIFCMMVFYISLKSLML